MNTDKIKINFKIIWSILLLVLIDQGIKVYISSNLMNVNIYFLNDMLGFKPHINTAYSWLNSLMNLGIGLLVHIILNIIILIISIAILGFIKQKNKEDKIINWLFTFLLAGTICSLIDRIFWGGSLDYIYLKNLFIFDLKDAYLTTFQTILILCWIFNYKGFRRLNERLLYNEFKAYIKVEYFKRAE